MKIPHRSIGDHDAPPGLTHADILTTILTEASGRPARVHAMIDILRATLPASRLDAVVPPAEMPGLLAGLRAELPGIRAWLAQDAAEVAARSGGVR